MLGTPELQEDISDVQKPTSLLTCFRRHAPVDQHRRHGFPQPVRCAVRWERVSGSQSTWIQFIRQLPGDEQPIHLQPFPASGSVPNGFQHLATEQSQCELDSHKHQGRDCGRSCQSAANPDAVGQGDDSEFCSSATSPVLTAAADGLSKPDWYSW